MKVTKSVNSIPADPVIKTPLHASQKTSGNTSTSFIKRHKKLFTCGLVAFLTLLACIILYFIVTKYISNLKDKYMLRQPEWTAYDKKDQEPKFALVKITSRLAPGDVEEVKNYFFRNKLSLAGGVTKAEECVDTEYKCGDSGWKEFDTGYVALSNRCMVKVKPETYCNVILPGGTLIHAANTKKISGFKNNLFDNKNLIFQVVITSDQITIKESATNQESSLWHIVTSLGARKYVVEVGDHTVTATGTEFYTSTSKKDGAVTGVTQGTVQVSNYSGKASDLSKKQYSQAPIFNVAACPPILKACGNSCIPANGICCDATSYCLSPVQCQENSDGKCKTSMFSGDSSKYCCSNDNKADGFSLFSKGSYDCKDGYKFCGMGCIPEDQKCCYPTNKDCPVAESEAASKTGNIPSNHVFPRQYFYDIYKSLLNDGTYKKYVTNASFPNDETYLRETFDYLVSKMKAKVSADYAKSDSTKEKNTFCADYPDFCYTPKKADDDSTSTSGSCPKDIKIISCYHKGVGLMVKNKPGYYQCTYKGKESCSNINGMKMCGSMGEIALPEKCLPKGFNSWSK